MTKKTRKPMLKCKWLQIECIPVLPVPYVHTVMRYLFQSYNIIQYTVRTCSTFTHADVAGNNVHSPAWRDGTHITGVVDVRVLHRKPNTFCWHVTCTLSSLGLAIPSFWKWWSLLSAIKGTPLLFVTLEWVSAAVMQNQWMPLGN